MPQVKSVFLALFGLNLLAVFFLTANQLYVHRGTSTTDTYTPATSSAENITYAFKDPFIAYHLLEKLDVYSTVEDKAIDGATYNGKGAGYVSNKEYCSQHRAHFANHPEMIFRSQPKIATNYWKGHQLRWDVVARIGIDNHKDFIPIYQNTKVIDTIPDPDTNMYFTFNLFYYLRQVGKQFSCLSQASNHIPGHNYMYRKDFQAEALVNYANSYKSRPQCFNYDQSFPRTFVLQKQDQCEEFFEEFLSEHYQQLKAERNVVFFRKIGADAHEGSGVFPVNTPEEEKIQKLYGNGTLCGKVKANNLIQYNVHNPLLLENRKFGFRMFLLVASVNPVIAYYHDGYARLSIDEYDPNSNATRTFVTNIGVNLKEALKDTAFAAMSEAEIQEYTYWELDKLGAYLNENGIVNDPDWVNNYLRPQFKKVMIHLVRMAQHGFQKMSSVFELFGLDYVMDDNLGLWFIESNTMPLITGFTKGSKVLFKTMLTDTFEIALGLTRSRMKRVIEYINTLIDEVHDHGLFVPEMNLVERRKEFQKVSANKFEPEFLPGPNNTFQKIIDENDSGVDRYAGLISAECL